MECCNPTREPQGYATPAALVLCLVVSTMAVAMVGRSLATLRLARIDIAHLTTEYDLDGAHLAAAAAIVRSSEPGPYRWTFSTDVGWVEALAEPDTDKIDLAKAAALSDAELAAFGVTDIAELRARLYLQATAAKPAPVDSLDVAPLWRNCAPSMIANRGRAAHFAYHPTRTPGDGPDPQSWRIGEAWRISITNATGWRDDRTVRFTGDAHHPISVVSRELSRNPGESEPCPGLLSALSAG